MRSYNKMRRMDSQESQYRQSLSMLSSQFIRNSLSIDSKRPSIYRESLGAHLKPRHSIAVELIEYLRQEFQHEQVEKDRASFSNLRSTLNDLQLKISQAKQHLDSGKSSITNQVLDEEVAGRPSYNEKTLALEGELNTTLSSSGKIQFSTKELHSNSQSQKISGYYLNNLGDMLEGRDPRALDHMNFSLRVLKNYYRLSSPTFADIQQKKVYLPKQKCHMGKKTLILDIDQTLIHCQEDPSKPYDIAVPVEIQNGMKANAYITIRPYAISFLKRMSKHFQIMAFTASHQSYADAVLDQIDPQRQYIKHRLYRKHCIQIYDKIFVKDLRVINRDLSSMVLVDNAPYSYVFQLENGIPILPYYSGEDVELVQLEKYLLGLAECEDVREYNKRYFQLHRYCSFQDSEELIKELYL